MTTLFDTAAIVPMPTATAVDAERSCGEAGRAAAAAFVRTKQRAGTAGRLRRRTRRLRRVMFSGMAAHPSTRQHRAWIAENGRLIAAAVADVQEFAASVGQLPQVRTGNEILPRVCALADAYLQTSRCTVDQDTLTAFLRGAQQVDELMMAEVWAMRPALQLVLGEHLVSAVSNGGDEIPALVDSLRAIADMRWKEVFAAVNVVDQVLANDPAGAYSRMDDESRDDYRRIISELSARSGVREREVAGEALALAEAAPDEGDRRSARRRHVGYYLFDDGVVRLRERIGYRTPLRQRIVEGLKRHSTMTYLAGIAGATTLALAPIVMLLGESVYALLGCALLLLPATQAAVDLVNTLITSFIPPRRLPRLDFERGVPDNCVTLVATPSLLISEEHVRTLVMDLEIRYLANRDRNVLFALVTNSADSREQPEERNAAVRLCQTLIGQLNARYGSGSHTPFYLLHRFRAYNPSERRWIGWERKRGKLLDLNQLLRGVRDRFPVKVGNIDALRRARYVLVLDSDTQLPRDAARQLIGTMAHPLNRAVIDPATRMVVEGYGILQPRISVSTRSAVRSWLANLYSGETGFDIYTRAVSDVYQDLFGEGIFTGKGLYEIDTFRESIERRFPANTLLSHDLIEGLFARVGLVTDVELVDDYPTHFSAYCRRRHRWMRGDWQVLRWLRNTVPDFRRQPVSNPLGAIARWKILDNLRRTVIELSTLGLLLVSWLALPAPVLWTLAAVALWLVPTYARLLLALTRIPRRGAALRPWIVVTIGSFLRAHVIAGLQFAYLLHDALLSLDAIGRALVRMFVTRQRLLEWETAAEAAMRTRGATDVYLEWSPVGAAGLGVLLAWVRPGALWAAALLLVMWVSAGAIARWLNRRPRIAASADLTDADTRFLREQALRTWHFFSAHSSHRNNWLVPDSVRESGPVADRLSPTNLGLLLNARIAAVHLGYLTLPEFVAATNRTLRTMGRLRRYRGHFLNWYDNRTLEPLEPKFVSTVDSGNLAASLWALKQAALSFAAEQPGDDVLWAGIVDVALMLGRQRDPSARALCERILRSDRQWRASIAELEEVVRHFAAAADTPGARRWSAELRARLQHARRATELSASVREGLEQIAAEAEAYVRDMDFAFLYDSRRKVLSVGYDTASATRERSTYDLLASESRIAAFVAVAKGDAPQESWLHLGRTLSRVAGQRVLVSWTGTLFEYLMPALWFRHRPRTIMFDSMRAAVAVQRQYARDRRIPWGFSESAYVQPGSDEYGYGPCGVPDLAVKPMADTAVVAPYASFLALLVDRRAAIANLRRLQELRAYGDFGMFEAVDFTRDRPEMVRMWMSHHQGMSLVAVAEVLAGRPMQRAFHAEPLVRATERILEERVPVTVVPAPPDTPRVLWPEESVA